MARRGGTYLFYPARKRSGARGCLLTGLFFVLAIVTAVLLINSATNTRLELSSETVTVMGLDKTFEGFTVLHVSDLHGNALGSDAQMWEDLLYGKRFDAVVMTGDMVGSAGNAQPLTDLIASLRSLNAKAPIYFIEGDDDPDAVNAEAHGSPEALADWVLRAQEAGAIYLDAPVRQEVGKYAVWFTPEYLYGVDAQGMAAALEGQKASMEAQGVPYQDEGGASYRALCYRLDAMNRTAQAVAEVADTDLQIALSHMPLEADYIRTSLEWAPENAAFSFRNISLLLAGHYCAGQWRLPGLGALYVPEWGWLTPDENIVGMQRVNSINQYISKGMAASEAYPMDGRLLNPPGITLLRFTGTLR